MTARLPEVPRQPPGHRSPDRHEAGDVLRLGLPLGRAGRHVWPSVYTRLRHRHLRGAARPCRRTPIPHRPRGSKVRTRWPTSSRPPGCSRSTCRHRPRRRRGPTPRTTSTARDRLFSWPRPDGPPMSARRGPRPRGSSPATDAPEPGRRLVARRRRTTAAAVVAAHAVASASTIRRPPEPRLVRPAGRRSAAERRRPGRHRPRWPSSRLDLDLEQARRRELAVPVVGRWPCSTPPTT